jgi:transcriptional regulator with XRE-family HTH domain
MWFEPTPKESLAIDQEFLQVEVTEVLHEAMSTRRVNRAELARRSGITRSALSQRLSGRRSMTLKTLASMLHHLGFRLKVELVDSRHEPRAPEAVATVLTWQAERAGVERRKDVTSGAPRPW